jgi:eukaryotic-like serine/threonine-protein kinase
MFHNETQAFTPGEKTSSGSREERLDQAIAAFLQEENAGSAPDPQAWLERYPDLAEELSEFFADRRQVEQLAAPMRAALARGLGSRVKYVGDYELLEELGRGGMGVVYRAQQLSLKRQVALKMILAGDHASAEDLARFRAEAEAAASLQHPHIVQIYEIGEHEGRPYAALELVGGGSLAERLTGAPLPTRQAASLVETLARAVHAAHERGVVHRDLKPANVLLSPSDRAEAVALGDAGERFEPKITDFGLAKLMQEEHGRTRTGAVLGTPSYMAPEQAEGKTKEIGPAADIYSLGAILYELMTGRPPFRGETPLETIKQVVHEEPPPPSRLHAGAPKDLETICLKCLQKDPRKRYADAEQLAEDLRRFLEGKPIAARPVGRVERARKWVRRHPAVSALAAVVVLSLLVGTTLSTYFALQARDRAERAESELYLNRVMLAEREYAAGATLRARDLLRQCPPERRGWEWQYVLRLCLDSPANNLGRLPQPVLGAEFSREGDLLVTATRGGVIDIWDARSLQHRRRFELEEPIDSDLALSADGRRAAVCTNHAVAILNTDDGSVVWRREHGEPHIMSQTSRVRISPDGTAVAAAFGAWATKLHVWDTASDDKLWSTDAGYIYSLAFAEGGEKLVVGQSGEFLSYDARSGDLLQTLELNEARLGARGDWTPHDTGSDGQQILIRGDVGGVRPTPLAVHDLESGATVDLGAVEKPGPAALSPDGRLTAFIVLELNVTPEDLDLAKADPLIGGWLALLGKTRGGNPYLHNIHLHDTRTGRRLAIFRGFTGRPHGLRFSSDGLSVLAYGGYYPAPGAEEAQETWGEVRVWSVAEPETSRVLRGHDGPVRRLAFSPDGERLASADDQGAVRVWEARSGRLLQVFTEHQRPNRSENPIGGVAFVGPRSIASLANRELKIWRSDSGRVQRSVSLPDSAWTTGGLTLRLDGRQLAFADREHIHLVEAATGAISASWQEPRAQKLAFDPQGRRLAAAYQFDIHGELKVFDVATQKTLLHQRVEPEAFSLFTTGWGLVAIAFSPDGKRIVAGGNVGPGRVFDSRSGKQVLELAGHTYTIMDVAYSPDGSRIATASYDHTVKLWDAQTGREVYTFRDFETPVLALAFSPDASRLVAAGHDGTVRIWEAGPPSPDPPPPPALTVDAAEDE